MTSESTASSRKLVELAMHGDREAFGRLAERDLGRLTGAAQLIVRDAGWAEDATQEALLRAWRDLPRLRDPDRYRAWLQRLLVRACYDLLRRYRREQRKSGVTWVEEADSTIAAAGLDDRDELERGLQRLSAEQRTLLVLAYYVQLSHREIAHATGLPLGTVKSRLSRALQLLRAELDAETRRGVAQERMA